VQRISRFEPGIDKCMDSCCYFQTLKSVQSSGKILMGKLLNRENYKDNLKLLLLLVLMYEVHVYTGAKLGAETDSDVYINLIGTRGDAGKRKLHRSKNNNIKFRHGQVKKKQCYF